MRKLALLSAALLAVVCPAQWDDARRLGTGGESTVATDGLGTVYVTSHIPTQIFVSRDFGETFGVPTVFADALGDMLVLVRGKGEATISYMPPAIDGMITHTTNDFGATFAAGKGIRGRPLDREWMAYDAASKTTYMNYSDGYIGGPKSKGVFLSASVDGGMTWAETSRIDKEREGVYAIDPGLAISSAGTVYALWTTTVDYNTVENYKFAYSDDGGKSFKGHTTVSTVTKGIGDTQERWMLGGVCANGPNEVTVFFVNYRMVATNDSEIPALLVMSRTSRDGGKTFEEPMTVLGEDELRGAVSSFAAGRPAGNDHPFIQCLSWASYDPKGRVHFVWQDCRAGYGEADGTAVPLWQVRHAVWDKDGALGVSEQVSASVACKRPPLDFMSCAADEKYAYISWTETPESTADWNFTGDLWFARKANTWTRGSK